MKTIVQTGTRAVETRDAERPTPADDEVLVAVHSASICGSDAHAYGRVDGYEWVPVPRIMGHEYAGEIVAVGAAVEGFAPGDRVVEEPVKRCGECLQCTTGQENVCQNFEVTGIHTDGVYAEYRAVDPDYLFRVPDGMALGDAAITEPTSVTARAVLTRSSVGPGDDVLVQGPGPIGNLTAQIARGQHADVTVAGLERDAAHRLPLLADLGMDTLVVGGDDDPDVRALGNDGAGFDTVFDATGDHRGPQQALDAVRKGGEIVTIGLPGGVSELFVTDLVRSEIDFDASYSYRDENFEQAVALIEDGVVDVPSVLDSEAPIDRPDEAFESFLDCRTCKPVFRFADL